MLIRSTDSSASLETCVAWSDKGGSAMDRHDSVVDRRASVSYDRRVVVNVSGLRFETHLSTIERFSGTLLGDSARRDRLVSFFCWPDQTFVYERHLLTLLCSILISILSILVLLPLHVCVHFTTRSSYASAVLGS